MIRRRFQFNHLTFRSITRPLSDSVSSFGPQDTQDRLAQEEEARNALNQAKKKLEQELNGQKKDIEDLELTIQKGEQDKATKDHQIRNLNDEIAHQDELISKLNKEKKQLQVNGFDIGLLQLLKLGMKLRNYETRAVQVP